MLGTRILRRNLFWSTLLAAAAMMTAAPDEAQAGRRLTRRALPIAARASTAGQTPDTRNPAVEAGVARLLAASAGSGPTRAAAGEGRDAHLTRSSAGFVRALVAPSGGGWTVSRPGPDQSPEGLALAFLREHRVALGLSKDAVSLQSMASRRGPGRSYVRLAQRFAGLPVFGASVVVQVEESGRVSYVLSDIARDDADLHTPGFDVQASIDGGEAAVAARGTVPHDRQAGLDTDAPELMIYEPSVIGSAGPSRLVWHVRVRNPDGAVNEVVLVDAVSGDVAFHYSDVKHVKNRSIYDHGNNPVSTGTLVRSEGGPASGIADADYAYDYFGDTYDFYSTRFGRDSYDGAGAPLVGRVRYCEPDAACPYANAYWNGSEMRFGQGFAADDVVAHELTHAVTERESNLMYWGEAGAINEALSDIFGEFVDLTNTGGNDGPSVRWLIGEDIAGGPIRSMSDPTAYGDPDRRLSPFWYSGSEDNRGVHFNSGVANKLAFLLTDGGSFNGQIVTAQGMSPVAGLLYEAQVNLLGPASDYFDLYAALRQAAKNTGWAAASRDTLEAATRAVEINLPGNAVTVSSEGFDGSFPPAGWEVFDFGGLDGNGIGTQWGRSTQRTASGSGSAWCAAGGTSPAPAGGPYKPLMDTWMVYGPISLADAQAAWAEFDVFLDLDYGYDEVFWGVAGPPDPITGEQFFDGYAVSPGPDGYSTGVEGTPGWAHELFNFKEFPGVLGQPQVWLAFNFVSDDIVEYEGAYVDNVSIQKAPTAAPIGSFDTPTDGSSGLTGTVSLQGWALDDLQVTKVSIYRDPVSGETPGPNGKVYVGDATQVAGLRPDIEAAYPTYPYAYRAGWTYSFLWSALPLDGNRTFAFHAYAYDADARSTLLGSRTLAFQAASPALRRDFDADGKSDILWRHSSGAVYLWMMDGTSLHASTYVPPIGLAWKVAGMDDFDGDGKTDILWREQSSGATYIWFMSAGSVLSQGYTSSGADNTWQIQGTGDLNGDGKADILWRDTNGALYVWLMNGTSLVAGSTYLPPISLAWQIKGLGDFNGDGKTDILWRENTSGASYLWLMNGAATIGAGYTSSLAQTDWAVQGVGDFDGNGKSDILWRQTGGALYVWLMNGTSVASSTYLPPISTVWQIEKILDLDGNGKADILWREATAGSTYVWLMNGAVTTGVGYTQAQADLTWAVQPD